MAYTLTNEERETVILFNEADKTASISTFNGALIRKLTALSETRPNEVTYEIANEHGEHKFIIPKKWVKVNASLILSDEQKAALSLRCKQNFMGSDPTAQGVEE